MSRVRPRLMRAAGHDGSIGRHDDRRPREQRAFIRAGRSGLAEKDRDEADRRG
jgi:hypothetical protein